MVSDILELMDDYTLSITVNMIMLATIHDILIIGPEGSQ
ncbi:hypothetical protein ECHHL_0663 [Ehrlichia chaffeensis str. Heartland]|nr:hypothetical protein ECHHL_0663 [Ehrlichia chaffeensis str. Heartland]AHX05465.1 hypothetical protein ECHJAX_0390 [Ehrlichia chaffeensis str. Jax]AHX06453.1 hypothetical protein ECHLIB_0387 [Ehrlichia chaffeensis str. Liberty]AHX09876.1 hypothetical protein ECHWAK_0387 [Ehrlichia chaffeensis str. Wakulla]AHX10424.1 hypothetical protein ECHWP_0658 [Ehrlichia chaffeensis str. West Paces]